MGKGMWFLGVLGAFVCKVRRGKVLKMDRQSSKFWTGKEDKVGRGKVPSFGQAKVGQAKFLVLDRQSSKDGQAKRSKVGRGKVPSYGQAKS